MKLSLDKINKVDRSMNENINRNSEDTQSAFFDAKENEAKSDSDFQNESPFLDLEEDFYGPILRHPYYNEVTEELGGSSISLLLRSGSESTVPTLTEIPLSPEKKRAGTIIEADDLVHSIDAFKDADDADPENTCHINYGLLKRYLASLSSKSLERESASYLADRFSFYSTTTGFIRARDLSELEQLAACGDLPHLMQKEIFWLDVCSPSSLDLRILARVFRMHPLTLEDLQLDDMREKCDVFENYFIICLKAIEPHSGIKEEGKEMEYSSVNPQLYTTENIYVLVSPIGVLSIHHHELKFTSTIVKRIRLLSARSGLITDWITYGILDDIIDALSPVLYELEQEVENIDDTIMATKTFDPAVQTDMLRRITMSRKRVTQLLRLLKAKTEVVRTVMKRCHSRLTEDALVYLRDLQDHVAMMEANLEHQDENLNRCYANYLAQLSIETSYVSNKMSQVMKKMSALASILIPWSIVTGMWGMNVRVPFFPYGTEWEDSYFPFCLLVSIMCSATAILYIIGRKRDWF